ncbi:hypothetical protein IWZ00DRAFT_490880 [Phyllosticta capitalensis]
MVILINNLLIISFLLSSVLLPLVVVSSSVKALTLSLILGGVENSHLGGRKLSFPRPRPYYAAGLHSDAFTNEQRRILWEMVVERTFENYNSLCWVTQNLYFPFLVVEPVHGSYGDAEDRNTANVLIAMRGTVELFRLARREQEICREILAFSGIFTHSWIRIFAHFADGLEGGETPRFYYHEVFKSMFPEDKWTSCPEDKWASYKFVKNIYKVWAPMHHKRICSAIETVANLSESSS